MKVNVGFQENDRVTYNDGREAISAVVVSIHAVKNAPAGFEYEIRITGRSRTWRRGHTLRTDGTRLKFRSRPKEVTPKQEKRKRDNRELRQLDELCERLRIGKSTYRS